ncbi:MAG: tetratricopeptide repeat protein, partial [Pedobacter sp.]|nr:tetratricopeptide repeat protein [Pedobacter sp.]
MKPILFLFLILCGPSGYAQETIPEGRENNLIKELFFAGLKEKLVENYSNASNSFNRIIAIDPKNAAAYYELANLNYRQKKLLEAEVFIKKAISLEPKNSWYVKLQAEIYKRNGNMDALVGVFDQLIQFEPENSDLYFDKANAYQIAGKFEEAQK